MANVCTLWLLAGVLLLGGCASRPPAESADETAAPVEVTQARRQTIAHRITAEAILYPINQANIMPKASAPVRKFLVNRGDHVRQGQLVAQLEDRDLAAAAQESKNLYKQAQASYQTITAATMPEDLTKAQADVQSAKQTLDAANKVFENRQALLREGALAQKLVDDAKVSQVQAQSTYETARQHLQSLQTVGRPEQIKSAQAQVDAAQAHYENSQAQFSYAEITSPISGVVSDRPTNVGDIATTGSPVLSIVDISQVVARASVPVQEAAAIRVGRPATITGSGGELTGKVTVVSPAVDANTTTVQVWVQATNRQERLKPGVTVQITIDADEIADAIVIPAAALLSSEEGGDKVMVAGSDSLAHERKVEVGVRDGDETQILSGLKEGEQVITTGALGLDDKAKIEISKPGDKKVAGGPDEDKKDGASKE